jgi:hypothetical protein
VPTLPSSTKLAQDGLGQPNDSGEMNKHETYLPLTTSDVEGSPRGVDDAVAVCS